MPDSRLAAPWLRSPDHPSTASPFLLISLAALVFLSGYSASLWIGAQVVPDNAIEVGLIFWVLKAIYVFTSGWMAQRAFKMATGCNALLDGIFLLLSLWTLYIASQFFPWLAAGFFAGMAAVFLAGNRIPSYWGILPAVISASYPMMAANNADHDIIYALAAEGSVEDLKKAMAEDDGFIPHAVVSSAAGNPDIRVLRFAVEKFKDVNTPRGRYTPLMNAIMHKNLDNAQYLVDSGANVEYVNASGRKASDYCDYFKNDEDGFARCIAMTGE